MIRLPLLILISLCFSRVVAAGCEDTVGWFDGTNGCSEYASNSGWCDQYGGTDHNGQGTAQDNCCACGGGHEVKESPSACSCDSRDCYRQCFEVQKKYNTRVYKRCFEKQKALTADAEAKCSVLLSDANIKTAVAAWLSNSVDAEKTYGSINDWHTSRVTNMSSLFMDAEDFNDDIGNWDVSSVEDMSEMFSGAKNFNQDIGDWDVSSVTDMNHMFMGVNLRFVNDANTFNQDIGDWDVGAVTDMSGMFYKNYLFNQDIGDWDVSAVTDMNHMFMGVYVWDVNDAKTFNQWLKVLASLTSQT